MTEQHLEDVRAKIADLQVIECTLRETVAQCSDTEVPDCPVIDALFSVDTVTPSSG